MTPDRPRASEPSPLALYLLGLALAVLIGAGLTLSWWWPL